MAEFSSFWQIFHGPNSGATKRDWGGAACGSHLSPFVFKETNLSDFVAADDKRRAESMLSCHSGRRTKKKSSLQRLTSCEERDKTLS